MNTIIKLHAEISEELSGLRLDQALAKLYPDYSRSRIQTWIKAGSVTLDNKIPQQRVLVKSGQKIEIATAIQAEERWQAQIIPLDIVYEDADIIVINKPVGLVVHPGAGNQKNTLLNALLNYAPELVNIPRAGIVHRLDKETSGLLVIARSLAAHHKLIKQIQARAVKREYQAVVAGKLISGSTVDAPIGRHPVHRTKMAVIESGKPAVTHFRVMERFRAHSLLRVQLDTGRTHQIRVHMAHIHHPIVGDPQYGGRFKLPPNISPALKDLLQNFKRQALHAWRLEIKHPQTGKLMAWEAPLPEDMRHLLELLRHDEG